MDITKKPIYNVPQCEDLKLIVNRAALSLMKYCGASVSDINLAVDNPFSPSFIKYLLSYAYRQLEHGSYKDLARYYVECGDRFEYVFLLVRCGKCLLCCHSKQVDMINRVQMESACYSSPCYMITLTYSEKYLPCHRVRGMQSNSLYYPDVQKFFKRLRITWTRKGVEHDIRYLVAGEYGHQRHRPHYHILLWNNPYGCNEFSFRPIDVLNHKKLVDEVFNAWGMCERQSFQCEPAGDGAAGYVSKYITKQSLYRFYGARTKPFIRTSNRHGGIGSPMIMKYYDYYRNNSQLQDFTFRCFDGSVKSIKMTSYIKNKLFPSGSRQVSLKYKSLFRSLVDCGIKAMQFGLLNYLEFCNTLDYYSLGWLFYQVESPGVVVHQRTSIYYFARSRIIDCYNSLLDELDCRMPLECVDITAFNVHRLSQVEDDSCKDIGQRKLTINNYLFTQLSKEVV